MNAEVHPARRLWAAIEPVHAVGYFTPEVKSAGQAIGLKGFWMTYFAFRAAPMGPVGPGVVAATFAGFHPVMVRRAVPDAWRFATPEACLEARLALSAGTLRELGVDDEAGRRAADLLAPVIAGLDGTGRPLFAANAELPEPDGQVERLWQVTTTVREHRGDGHVAALVAAGVDGVSAHVLQAPAKKLPPAMFRTARGLSEADWAAAAARLAARGLLTEGETPELTDAGRALVAEVEARTDERSWSGGLAALGEDGVDAVVAALRPAGEAIAASGFMPYPNPVGLPRG
ncbi:hypothetical protein EV193_105212 [Herbihabitans rhizosphaerae]|uniref:SalK n=1 Tax=Herbihabitans rhizosphaerae TaxID=1872711 RepID=A0A4Q7KMT8_9PSEU|nr:hypothetical protein [Herbihabitans rhizosphaerae]RZS37654.1 hypothetical protein EV193_105212 [Herbihabitans rhizosphaerae]